MANPAELLHRQLVEWQRTKNQSQARGIGLGETLATWQAQRNAARNFENLLQLIEEMEEQGKPVDVEKLYAPKWAKAVYAFPRGWDVSSNGPRLTDSDSLNLLRSFAYRIDETLPPIVPGAQEDMLKAVEEAEKMNTSDLPQSLRLLLCEATAFMRKAIAEYEITGEFVLNTAVKKFIQVLELLKDDEPRAGFVSTVVARASRWYATPIASLVASGFISAELALAAPVVNEALTYGASNGIEALTRVFEVPALAPSNEATESGDADSEDTLEDGAQAPTAE